MNKNAKLLNSLLSASNTAKPTTTTTIPTKAKKKKVAKKKKSVKAMASNVPGMMMTKKGKC